MLVTVFAAVLICQLASAITLDDCPWSQTRDKYLQVFQGKCYYFNLALKKNYNDAKEVCQNEGGNLAMVKSKEINRFLNEELSDTYKRDKPGRVWIGLTDLGQEGVFRWSDGSSLDYEKFAPDEGPNAPFYRFLTRRLEDCVAMDPKTGRWYGYKCESLIGVTVERSFVCEFKAEYHPTFPTEGTTVASNSQPTSNPTSS